MTDQPKFTPGPLTVEATTDPRQHRIVSEPSLEDWKATYFEVSGHFGSYGPHIFAAAPDMFEALGCILELVDAGAAFEPQVRAAQDALAKARGQG